MSNKRSAQGRRIRRKVARTFRGTGVAKAAVVLCLVGLLGAGSALAYLTAKDSATNSFTVAADLKIGVEEPGWRDLTDTDKDGVPDVAEQMTPTQTVTKDPYIRNNSTTSAYVFARVGVPYRTVTHVLPNGTTQNGPVELFSYTTNAGWTEVGGGQELNGVMWHTYRYDTGAVGATERTATAIFSEVTLANIVEGQLSNETFAIQVDGYGIQSEGFEDCAAAYAAYTKQNPDSTWA